MSYSWLRVKGRHCHTICVRSGGNCRNGEAGFGAAGGEAEANSANGLNGVAVAADSSEFTIVNAGTMRGATSSDSTFAAVQFSDGANTQTTNRGPYGGATGVQRIAT